MKTILAVFIGFLLASQLAIGQSFFKKLDLSLEANFGVVNGNMLNRPVDMGWCFECRIEAQEQIPKIGRMYGVGAEVGIGRRHAIGLGLQVNEIRFDQKQIDRTLLPTTPDDIYTISVENRCRGWYLLHRIKLLHGKCVEFSLRNGLLYEKLVNMNEDYYPSFDFQKRGISYLGKIETAFKVGKRSAILISPIFRLALKNYNYPDSNEEKYLPYGAGLTIGWRSQII